MKRISILSFLLSLLVFNSDQTQLLYNGFPVLTSNTEYNNDGNAEIIKPSLQFTTNLIQRDCQKFLLKNNNKFVDNTNMYLAYLKSVYGVTVNQAITGGKLYKHLPVIYKNSSPVYLKLITDEIPGKIYSYKILNKDGDNNILEIMFNPLSSGENFNVTFECWVLNPANYYTDLPQQVSFSELNDIPGEAADYLNSSDIIQSDNNLIIQKANELKGTSNNIIQVAKNIICFAGDTISYVGYGLQDALSTLNRGYAVCTGKANLAAALFRALGIPARVLMVAYTHYLVEIYLPSYGWVRGESTIGQFPYDDHNNIVMFANTPTEEEIPGGGVMAYWGTNDLSILNFSIEYGLHSKHTKNESITCNSVMANEIIWKSRDIWRNYVNQLNTNSPLITQIESYQENYVTYFCNNDFYSMLNTVNLLNDLVSSGNIIDKYANYDFKLYQNYPNPFNNETIISVEIFQTGHSELKIYDFLGNEIKTLISRNLEKGNLKFTWDGTNNHNIKVSSGVYIYRFKLGNEIQNKKMVFIK